MSETQVMPVDAPTRIVPTVGYAAYAASGDLAPLHLRPMVDAVCN
jgi:hypothetical protein